MQPGSPFTSLQAHASTLGPRFMPRPKPGHGHILLARSNTSLSDGIIRHHLLSVFQRWREAV